MRASFRLVVFATAALVCLSPLSCGKKGGDEPGGGGGAASGGSGGGAGGVETGPTRMDKARVEKLVETEVEGFERGHTNVMGSLATIFYTATEANAHGRTANVQLTVGGCTGCLPMEAAAFEGRKENLMMMLSKAHKENPDLVFEIAEADFDGRKVIFTHSLSYVERTTEHGTSRSTSNGVNVFHNNGVNQLLLQVSGRGKGMASSIDELRTQFTREEMLAAARKVFAAFVDAL